MMELMLRSNWRLNQPRVVSEELHCPKESNHGTRLRRFIIQIYVTGCGDKEMMCSSLQQSGRTRIDCCFRVSEVGPLQPADSSSSLLTFRGKNKHLSFPAVQTGQCSRDPPVSVARGRSPALGPLSLY